MSANSDIDINNFCLRPHLVIVGAGATVDSIPLGDKNGMKSSVMKGFIKELGFSDLLSRTGIEFTSDNLEDIYSELAGRDQFNDIRTQLENRIYEYFSSLEIPDEITKYDLLVLSLTKKDCIATFNWDGLMVEAYQRMMHITDNLPNMLFLHGNVKVGYCVECGQFGDINFNCSNCKEKFSPSKLLYPIRQKNYNSDAFIKKQWCWFEDYLSRAAIVTIYGYSAPNTDTEAIDKITKAFTRIAKDRYFDQIQIIERLGFDPSAISSAWERLSNNVHGHLEIKDSFFDTYLAEFPRRSIEGYVKRNLTGWWGDSNRKYDKKRGTNYNINELKAFISPLLYVDPFESLSNNTL